MGAYYLRLMRNPGYPISIIPLEEPIFIYRMCSYVLIFTTFESNFEFLKSKNYIYRNKIDNNKKH